MLTRAMSALGQKQTFVAQSHVCFTPKSGHVQCKSRCPLWAISGREQPQQTIQYSITSSALASKLAGMFKPSVLAVFRLIINSYLVSSLADYGLQSP